MRRDDVLFWVEAGAALLLALFLLRYYKRFVGSLYRFATTCVGLFLMLGLVYAMVYGLVGGAFGIPYLFWHEDFWSRVIASFGVTVLLGVIGVIAYYLDPYPWSTDRKTAAWLAPEEYLKAYWRLGEVPKPERPEAARAPTALARAAKAGTETPPPDLRWWNYLIFIVNAAIDPLSIVPRQALFEPILANQVRLHRFLRTCRTPFLLLLLMPAWFPSLFSLVPPLAPMGGPLNPSLNSLDVRHDFRAYVASVGAWWLGIVLGVLFIKVLVWGSQALDWLFPDKFKESEVSAEPDPVTHVVPKEPACALAEAGAGCSEAGCPRAASRPNAPPPEREWMARWLFRALLVVAFGLGLAGWWQSLWHGVFRWVSPVFAFVLAAGVVVLAYVGLPRNEPWQAPVPPDGCRADRLRRVHILIFVLLFVTIYVALGFDPGLYKPSGWVTPALALCAALGLLTMVLAVINFPPRWVRVPVVVALIGWLGYANNDPFKNRFENLSYASGSRPDLRQRVDEVYFAPPVTKDGTVVHAPLVADVDALENWAGTFENQVAGGKPKVAGGKPKLVIVAVSGGATRSAYWSAVVLQRLEQELPGFGHHVRLITGASGGMLGMAYYVTYRRDVALGQAVEPHPQPPTGTPPKAWPATIPKNSLQPVASYIALKEVWRSLWPYPLVTDRGVILERDWKDLQYPLSELVELERAGKVPSLVFSPMLIEDGRQLLISNLDFGRGRDGKLLPTVMTRGRHVSYNDDGRELLDVSLPALEFYRLYPGSWKTFLVATAVRMNASFPYVSPAVNLPSGPPRRVVDAGYYDNYGIQLAAAWVRQNHESLERLTSGVLLVQVRDSSGVRERLDVDDAPATAWDVATRGFQFLTSPVDGLLKARSAVSSFRNDSEVESLNAPFAPNRGGAVPDSNGFYTTVIIENSAEVAIQDEVFWEELDRIGSGEPIYDNVREVSMTWYLTRAEQRATLRAIPPDPPRGSKWADRRTREAMRTLLAGQVFETLPGGELAKLTDARKNELRSQGKLCYGPGPERDVRFKRLEQLRNFERLQYLKGWWGGNDSH